MTTGTLLIKSIPDNREVILNGCKMGRTPYQLSAVTAGDYQMVLSIMIPVSGNVKR
ncbi:TPA: PEGA domain-containing protein [Candidatus Poribacteria bacterium]|nr:PEGA domain-containing protein [Candidatus Poribacteria bacterium]HIC02660.1 PEGA domain-containing protein [Candidatus Poribacteria bacterium]